MRPAALFQENGPGARPGLPRQAQCTFTVVPALELLPSLSSMMLLKPSTMAPRYHRPLLGTLAQALTGIVAQAPGARLGTEPLPSRKSPEGPEVMVVSEDR